MIDYLSQGGAMDLADKLTKDWFTRGYLVKFWTEVMRESDGSYLYSVRSNLVNGQPPQPKTGDQQH